jgi:Tfp pilus assembly protein PilX
MKRIRREIHGMTNNGAVLLLAMFFVLLLAILAASVIQTGVLELRMSGNHQFQEEAQQYAMAIATEIAESPGNFPLDSAVGYAVCAEADSSPGCNQDGHYLAQLQSLAQSGEVAVDYKVTRQGPLLVESFPVRESQGEVSGNSRAVAIFEISVQVDGGSSRLGSARVAQGIAVRLPLVR